MWEMGRVFSLSSSWVMLTRRESREGKSIGMIFGNKYEHDELRWRVNVRQTREMTQRGREIVLPPGAEITRNHFQRKSPPFHMRKHTLSLSLSNTHTHTLTHTHTHTFYKEGDSRKSTSLRRRVEGWIYMSKIIVLLLKGMDYCNDEMEYLSLEKSFF